MANNFLRYKYLMISRASSEEIYIGIKNIFAKGNINAVIKADDALKTASEINLQSQTKALTSLAEAIAGCLLIDGKGELNGGVKLDETIKENIDVKGAGNLIGTVTQYAAVNTGLETAFGFKTNVKPYLMQHIYCPVITESFALGLLQTAKVDSALKTALEIYAGNTEQRGRAEVAETILTEMQGLSELLSIALAGVATPIRIQGSNAIYVPIYSIAKIVNGHKSIPIVGKTDLTYRTKPSLFRWTKLCDIDEKRLSDIDDLSLEMIDLTEITK